MIEQRDPKIDNPIKVFKWWLKNLKKEKPHLRAFNYAKIRRKVILAKNLDVNIVSINKGELIYLRRKVLIIDAEIIELEKSDFKKYYFTATTHKIFALKKEVKDIEDRIKVLEKADPNGFKTLMTYKTFCAIIDNYNKKVMKALVEEGASIKLWNNLGYLYILKRKKEDMFSMSNIDWDKSKKFKQELIARGDIPKDKQNPEGKNWFQFHEDPDYLRIAWDKSYGACKVPNNSVYAFYASKSVVGISKYLVSENKKNSFLRDKYIEKPKKIA